MADSKLSRHGSTGSSVSTGKDIRCHHCAGPLSKEMETSHWTVAPLIRDSFSMIGSAVGGTTSAFYGFNHVMPVVRKSVKGPMWLHFFIGAPPVIVFSSAWQACRWGGSCSGTTYFLVLSCSVVILFLTFSDFEG